MKKQIKEKTGICTYSENHTLIFTPDFCIPGDVECTTAKGKLNMLADGTFQFDELPKRIRYRTKLIKKLAHGRISETHDGAFLLTLKVFKDEDVNVKDTLWDEAYEAGVAAARGI